MGETMIMKITKKKLTEIEKLIKKRKPDESMENVKNQIKKLVSDGDEKEVIATILAYEKGLIQSTQTNTEIVLVYTLIVAIATIVVTDCSTFAVAFIAGFSAGIPLLFLLSIFKTWKTFKHNFLISVLENWIYEETKEKLPKETEKELSKQIDKEGYIEYTVRVKEVNKNQPSND